jgi:two-component system, OmpR family, sensor histidine kinase VicK
LYTQTVHTMLDFKALFTSLPGPHLVIGIDDPTFTILYENEAHAQIGLTDTATAVGQPFFNIFPDTTAKFQETGISDLAESFRQVIHTGEPDTMPLLRYDIPDKDGTFQKRWWRATHYPVKDDIGELLCIYQSTADITEEIEARRQLELTQGQLDSALEVGLVSTWYWDVTSDVVIGDKNLAKHFGIDEAAAARGLPLQSFINSIDTADRPRVLKAIEATAKSGKHYEQEYKTYDKSGNAYWVIARGRRFQNEHLTYLAGTLIDVTSSKMAESENIRLRELNRVKDEFVSLASHQLRTPATSVRQYLNILIEGYAGALTDEQLSFIRTADAANSRQLKIIEGLLKTAQLDTSEYRITRRSSDFNTLVQRTIREYASFAASRDQHVIFDRHPTPLRTKIDRSEMSICLTNLIENASKYSPKHSTINIRTYEQNHSVVFEISDSGAGIAAQDQKKIFDKFARINNEFSSTTAGNGLGLYWVKRIVELHGGTIRVVSKIGQGSTFTIELPI